MLDGFLLSKAIQSNLLWTLVGLGGIRKYLQWVQMNWRADENQWKWPVHNGARWAFSFQSCVRSYDLILFFDQHTWQRETHWPPSHCCNHDLALKISRKLCQSMKYVAAKVNLENATLEKRRKGEEHPQGPEWERCLGSRLLNSSSHSQCSCKSATIESNQPEKKKIKKIKIWLVCSDVDAHVFCDQSQN